jgi:hypothetical protein
MRDLESRGKDAPRGGAGIADRDVAPPVDALDALAGGHAFMHRRPALQFR